MAVRSRRRTAGRGGGRVEDADKQLALHVVEVREPVVYAEMYG
jgi:hypothetical protein